MTAPPTAPGLARAPGEQRPSHGRSWSHGRGVLWSGIALVVAQAVLRGWVGLRGYLTIDDFLFTSRAATMRLGDPGYLLHSYNGHLMPGAFAEVWLLTRAAPLQIAPVVAVDVVLQAATGLVLLALLRELFGPRKAVLVPLALLLFSPVTLPGFLWWAAALNQLPAMLAMVSTLYLHVRYLRSGRTRTGLYALLAFVLGLAFFEKLLLFAPLLFLFTAMYFVGGSWWRRLVGTFTLHWRVWTAWAVVLLPYVAYYRLTVNSTVAGHPSPTGFLDMLDASLRGLRAGAVTGPWSWIAFGGGPANTLPNIGVGLSALSWVVLLLVVLGSAATFRQALRAWSLPLAYFVATVVLLAAGRFQIGPVIGYSYRYFSEVALLAAIALPLGLLPLVGSVAKGELTVLRPRAWVGPLRSWRPGGEPSQPWTLSSNSRRVAVRFVVVAVVVSSLLSTVRYDAFWKTNVATGYVATAAREFQHAGPDLVLADTAVPGAMMPAVFFPANTASHALAPLPHQPRYLRLGAAADSLRVLDDTGHIRELTVHGIRNEPGPRPACGWFASGSLGTTVPMQNTAFDYAWTVRIGYIASEDTRATVSAGRQTVHVQLQAGLHALYLLVDGEVPSVGLDGLSPGASVCTDDVRVGTPVALPG